MEISQNIRELRRARGLTQEQLAAAMGVSGAAVSKWETGQCAPDLSLLAALADYFEVSVDCLLGHTLRADRLDALLQELKALSDAGDAAAESRAEAILRNYPNSYTAVEGCADAYYSLYCRTEDRRHIERSIELTRRLFALAPGEPDAKRLARMNRLGNQYELLNDWKQALQYYTDGNVGKSNDRFIAKCLWMLGRTEDAIDMLSDTLFYDAFSVFFDTACLAQIWKEQDRPDRAGDLALWAANALEGIGCADQLRIILYTIAAQSCEAAGDPEQAKALIHQAAALADSDGRIVARIPEFLRFSKPHSLTTTSLDDLLDNFSCSDTLREAVQAYSKTS